MLRRTPTPITLLSRRITNKHTFNSMRIKFPNIISIIMNKAYTSKTLGETTKSFDFKSNSAGDL
jgi:hypothetical protein